MLAPGGATGFTKPSSIGDSSLARNIGSTPGGVAVDKTGKIYVTTEGPNGIIVYQPDGTFIKSTNTRRTAHSLENLARPATTPANFAPATISIRNGVMLVAELAGRAVLLDKDFKILSELGDNPLVEQRANFNVPAQDLLSCAPRWGLFLSRSSLNLDNFRSASFLIVVSKLRRISAPKKHCGRKCADIGLGLFQRG